MFYSYTPGTVVNVSGGGSDMPGGAVGSVQYNFDGTNFGGFGSVDTGSQILTLTGYEVTAGTFNGVALTTGGSKIEFLSKNGSYRNVNSFDESLVKAFDTQAATGNQDLITELGAAGGINIVYDPTNSQFAIDLSTYAGAADLITVSMQRRTVIETGSGPAINEAWGDFTIVPSAQAVQYFAEDPASSPDPTTPLPSAYQFADANGRNGSRWELYCQLYDTSAGGMVERFWLNATQSYDDSGHPVVVTNYEYIRVS